MTPKEKAKELVDDFRPYCGGYTGGKINKEFARHCALIVVDEIINGNFGEGYDHKYWIEVRAEIKNY